ncbi:TIGR04222 domain-containing membrane protein [Nocardia sp. NRRL S-836]|uniref:TIGR04222 domain-containing membrane protein n=1 Tax=Nocardia sp. NRRL S-836 TaxID=1519492 RepID=UPI000A9C24DB|nr:TIGR04222 domain-containing membrane protein [Nocardia sp. NRRL S-836]
MAKSSTRTDWSAEEIGFLAGGPARAAQAALARLMDDGLVRVSREGLVTAVHQNGHGATTRIEARILTGVQGAGQPMVAVIFWVVRSAEMASLRQSLVDRGLLERKPRSGLPAAAVALLVVITVVLFGLGFADHVFWLPAIVPLFLMIVLRKKGPLTAHGKNVLKYARHNLLSRPHTVAMNGFTPGKRRRSTSDSGGWQYTAGSGYVYTCGTSSSCSGSSCSGSGCSSSSCGGSSGCGSSSSSCGSSSSSSCSSSSCSSSSSSCGSSS